MSLPQLLLVDDSEAILSFEKAALSGHYHITTASNGMEALERVKHVKPDAMLLDLSMPQMDGDEVFARMQEDPELADIPVIIISSERQRAEACVKAGAKAYLPKPVKADDLLALVGRVLEEARLAKRRGGMAIVAVGVSQIDVALSLDCVRMIIHQPATRPLPTGPFFLSEFFVLHGRPVCILDLARRLGMPHEAPVEERKLVVFEKNGLQLALCVDRVRDPEEIAAADVLPRESLGGAEHGPLKDTLLALVRSSTGVLPVLDPAALLSPQLLRELPALVRELPSIQSQTTEATDA